MEWTALSPTPLPNKDSEVYTNINVLCVCEHNSEGDGYENGYVLDSNLQPPLPSSGPPRLYDHEYLVFVNTVQKEMD